MNYKTIAELDNALKNNEITAQQYDELKASLVTSTSTTPKRTAKTKSKGTGKSKAEQARLKRNKDSREWKKAHKVSVRAYNKAWALEQAGKKKEADAMRAKVAGDGWKKYDWKDGQLVLKASAKRTSKPSVQKDGGQPPASTAPVAA